MMMMMMTIITSVNDEFAYLNVRWKTRNLVWSILHQNQLLKIQEAQLKQR